MSGLNGVPHPKGEAWGKPIPSAGGGGGGGGGGRTPGCIHLIVAALVVLFAIAGWLS